MLRSDATLGRMTTKWDIRFLRLAEVVAGWSKDPSTQCGAVIIRPDKTVASMGFNGFPKGCDDDPDIYANRELKYARVVHAEVNAILHAQEPLQGYTLYSWPPANGPSCDRCTAQIIQAGITTVIHVMNENSDIASRWQESIDRGLDMYHEAGVQVLSVERNHV